MPTFKLGSEPDVPLSCSGSPRLPHARFSRFGVRTGRVRSSSSQLQLAADLLDYAMLVSAIAGMSFVFVLPSCPVGYRWPMTLADAPSVMSACRDDETQRWLPLPNPYRLQDAVDFINGLPGLAAAKRAWIFAVRSRVRNRLIGCIGVHLQCEGVVMLAYWIAHDRGHGHAARAVRLAARFAFDVLGARRAELLIDSQNVSSQRAALRAGAIYEGLRRNAIRAAGQDHNCDIFSLVPSDVNGD
ncbi:MAG: GNAT family N-acetyltransferase [Pseudonocardiales bacterium]